MINATTSLLQIGSALSVNGVKRVIQLRVGQGSYTRSLRLQYHLPIAGYPRIFLIPLLRGKFDDKRDHFVSSD
ncbi:hypothetical protein DN757_19340 [Paenibacillus silvae]|uniref:Uncharacterized protein n=1 Tax=Paenibacillus silvae TaxID=1325358 RepID=A0A2W6NDG1_9BACL|nr:hypothetical protein DN757_19340 [Paenibacillus silvae]